MLSKPVWGYLIDRSDARRLASVSALVTAAAMLAITLSVRANIHPLVYASFFLLGCGWGGLIPLQEVVWATFFGRRYLGAVRSAGLPFALILGAGGPLLVSIYFDAVGNYDGAFYAVAALNVLSAILLLFLPPPWRDTPAAPDAVAA
jgi:MFS family permease